MTDKELVDWLRNCSIYEGRAFLRQAADRIEALEAEVERLRFHLDTALEALIMEGVCDGECGACKAARAALGEKQ